MFRASEVSTNAAVTPNRANVSSRSFREGPYTDAVLTTWAPWPRSAMYAVDTAPIPELVATPPHPSSSAATHSSRARTVGFPRRV
jgi:hypothetical protein